MFSRFRNHTSAKTGPCLQLYNTASSRLEDFTPHSTTGVTVYSCGPTVYDYAHIGNLRAYVFVDTLIRTLQYNHYKVIHTLNFTDFGHLSSDADNGEDKMMKGLQREGLDISLESMRLLSDRYIAAFKQDMQTLNVHPPSTYARASDYVAEQIELIEILEQKGHTYQTSDGVYFSIDTYSKYGKLGNVKVAEQNSRLEANPEKKHPADFALWKFSDMGWSSRWGTGFPGWHIECSAMALSTLGDQIDIHTGGIDHIHIHHNAEIAQCECATGKPFANYWLHNEHLQMQNVKIAKSAGTNVRLKDIQEAGYNALEFRYLLLQSHYRTPAQFSYSALDAAKQSLHKLYQHMFIDWADSDTVPVPRAFHSQVTAAINDDLNTPKVIALLYDVSKNADYSDSEKRSCLLLADTVLGLGLSLPAVEGKRLLLGHYSMDELPNEIQKCIQERENARVVKDWNLADTLRDKITAAGYQLEDTPSGPLVRHME